MDLDCGELARIDRKLLAGLGRDETYRSASISMGRAIVAPIYRELASAFDDSGGDGTPVLAQRVRE